MTEQVLLSVQVHGKHASSLLKAQPLMSLWSSIERSGSRITHWGQPMIAQNAIQRLGIWQLEAPMVSSSWFTITQTVITNGRLAGCGRSGLLTLLRLQIPSLLTSMATMSASYPYGRILDRSSYLSTDGMALNLKNEHRRSAKSRVMIGRDDTRRAAKWSAVKSR